ncbi:MAG: glycoside hydrolase family 3 protein, partial [Lachnospiraceae bacterium]|nr:glycoside hydrolase family 3 protein [Lachnospiraceae bacterium]
MKILRKVLTMVSFFLAAVMVVGTVIANENAPQINDFLKCETYRLEETGASTKLEDMIYFKSDFATVGEVRENAVKTAQQVVIEGTVLLKNENNALPLAKTAKVTLVGAGAYDPVYGGTGSGGISGAAQVKYDKSLEDVGLTLNPVLKERYTSNDWKQYKRAARGSFGTTTFEINDVPWDVMNEAAGDSFKEYGDAAIFVVSRRGGEGYDLNGECDGIDKGDGLGHDYLGLNEREWSIFNGLKAKKAAGEIKKIIVVVNFSSMIEGDFIKDPAVDAAIWAGAPGAGNAEFGKILVGDHNPSGRLSDTMWMDNAKNPTNVNFGWWTYPNAEALGVSMFLGTKNYPEITLGSYMVYQEGMYNGYRYTETRYEDLVLGTPKVGSFNYDEVVAYPFGHGLSYSNFELSDAKVVKTGDREYTVTVKVTNKADSKYDGKFSVPIWVSKPYNDYAKKNGIQVPTVELINMGKTNILKPGESQTLEVKVDEKFFASYDAEEAKGYVLLGGDYYVIVGGSAHEAANHLLMAKKANGVKIDESKMVGTGDASLVTKFNIGYNKAKYERADQASTTDGLVHIVTNLFDEADINRYSGRGSNHVDYYDRSNWEAVSFDMVNGHPKLQMTEQMAYEVYAQVPDQTGVYTAPPHTPEKYVQPIPTDNVAYPTMGKQAGLQLIDMMYDSEGNPISFFDPAWDTFMDQLTWDELKLLCSNGYHLTEAVASIGKPGTKDENGPNGWTRFNFTNRQNGLFYLYEKEKGHVDEAGKLINDQIDQNGRGSNLSAGFPSNGLLAATFNLDLAYKVGNAIGNEGVWGGWSGIYGTGLNIHRTAYLGRTSEYFSECGTLSGLMGAQWSRGCEEKGVHVYNKHCALNDLESCRHGVQVWLPEQALREIYLRAFELPITMGGAFNTMASFSRFGTYSGAACAALAKDFLRGECGMKGV